MKDQIKLTVIVIAVLGFLFGLPILAEAKSGCCSWHGGVSYCDTSVGRYVCNDGTHSPSCGCSRTPIYIPTYETIPSHHYQPAISKYRLYRTNNSFTIWELSDWQSMGFGTKKAFSSPKAFETRYGRVGWNQVKPITQSELNKYQDFGIYK